MIKKNIVLMIKYKATVLKLFLINRKAIKYFIKSKNEQRSKRQTDSKIRTNQQQFGMHA